MLRVGLLADQCGPLRSAGLAFEDVAKAAVYWINKNGGANGHPLEVIVKDTHIHGGLVEGLYEDLVTTHEAIAVVGPVTTGQASLIYSKAAEFKVPVISPSATGTSLAAVADESMFLRSVPNDQIQGLAIAVYYIKQLKKRKITTIVSSGESYSEELAASFDDAFGKLAMEDAPTEGEADNEKILFNSTCIVDTPPESCAAATKEEYIDSILDQVLERKMTAGADQVFIITFGGLNADFANRYIERIGNVPPAMAPEAQKLDWFFADGARLSNVLQTMSPLMRGMKGTAPTFPKSGDAYGEFIEIFGEYLEDEVCSNPNAEPGPPAGECEEGYTTAYERYGCADGQPDRNRVLAIGDEVFTANVWDAVNLIGAGVLVQSNETPDSLGGQGLARAITTASRGPGVILHAGLWRDIEGAVRSGGAVDYDGAAGPMDLDSCGETIGPYELWRIDEDSSGANTFAQADFFEARDLERQAGDIERPTCDN